MSFLLFISILSFFHSFDLINYLKVFVNSYLNPVTMQRRGFQLFAVVSPVLPDIFNILWFIALTIVLLGEKISTGEKLFRLFYLLFSLQIGCSYIQVFTLFWVNPKMHSMI